MPIGSNPDDTVPVILATDKIKPDPKPTFFGRHLTVRELHKVEKLRAEAAESKDEDQSIAKIQEAISICLAGWRDVMHRGKPMEFGRDEPADFLSVSEIWELSYALPREAQVKEHDLKNFGSQPASAVEPSAPGAAPVAA